MMDQLRAQLGNYLEWLESRGLSGPVAFRAPHLIPQQPDTESNPQTAKMSSETAQSDARSAAALRSAAPASVPSEPRASQETTEQKRESWAPGAQAPKSAAFHESTSAGARQGTDPTSHESKSPEASQSSAGTQREAGMPWKVGFYSSSDLTEEEFIMVSKIALALGLPAEDFKIWAEDSLVHVPVDLLRCSYIVALGPGSGQTLLALGQTVGMNTIQKALQGAPLLTIPHPRAMLKEPGLKGGAWTALQKLKAMMVH